MGRCEAGAACLRRSEVKVDCGRVGAAALGVHAVRAFAGGVIVEVEG